MSRRRRRLTFTLEVCDEADPTSLCDTDTVVITVNPAPVEDTAADGERRTRPDGHEGALVTLNGTGSSDPNGEALTYNWTAPAGITLTGATTAARRSRRRMSRCRRRLTFTLEVCDEADRSLCSDPDTVVVTVNPAVEPPEGKRVHRGPARRSSHTTAPEQQRQEVRLQLHLGLAAQLCERVTAWRRAEGICPLPAPRRGTLCRRAGPTSSGCLG